MITLFAIPILAAFTAVSIWLYRIDPRRHGGWAAPTMVFSAALLLMSLISVVISHTTQISWTTEQDQITARYMSAVRLHGEILRDTSASDRAITLDDQAAYTESMAAIRQACADAAELIQDVEHAVANPWVSTDFWFLDGTEVISDDFRMMATRCVRP